MATETNFVEAFAQNIKKLMLERGVSASVVCQATGIAKSSFSEWLAGRQPKLDRSIVKLARFFGVTVEYLVTGEHPEQEIVSNMLEDLSSGFVSIHRGVYRINVEKYAKPSVSKKNEGEK